MSLQGLCRWLASKFSDTDQPEEHDQVQLDASDGVIDHPLPEE